MNLRVFFLSSFRLMLEESMDQDIKSVINPGGTAEASADGRTKEDRRREREEARRAKRIAQKQQEEEKKLESKIALEERKILIAQRKLESMRLLEELFNRVKAIVSKEEQEKYVKDMKEAEARREVEEAEQEKAKLAKLEQQEQELQEKIQQNIRLQEEAAALAGSSEAVEEFELRKSPIEGERLAGRSPSTAGGEASQLPRSLLLAGHQAGKQASLLYDEEVNGVGVDGDGLVNMDGDERQCE